jgi:hypothetical protein
MDFSEAIVNVVNRWHLQERPGANQAGLGYVNTMLGRKSFSQVFMPILEPCSEIHCISIFYWFWGTLQLWLCARETFV